MRFLRNKLHIFKQDVMLLFFAVQNPDTPVLPKALALLTLVYIVSPVDAIPDFIPFFGYIDDLLITPLLISTSVKLLPLQVIQASEKQITRHRRRMTLILVNLLLIVVAVMIFLFLLVWHLFRHLF